MKRMRLRRRPSKPKPLQRKCLPPVVQIATMSCDHVATPERLIEQKYGIEAYYPAISEMFSEPDMHLRVYASPGRRDLMVAAHEDMTQIGMIGHTRIDDILGHRDVAERMTRDDDVNDECIDLFYRQHHAA